MSMSGTTSKGGYYKVHTTTGEKKIPYIVFALSDYLAARLVREISGYMANEREVEGPLSLK